MTNLKPGFFEFIGIADAERIHSEMISWMLSVNSPLKTLKAKNQFLGVLLNLKSNFEEINSVTEFKSVDIMIVADNDIFIIENKLKSSEHSGQTTNGKYEDKIKAAIKKKEGQFTSNEELKNGKYYLTLIDEKAKDSKWVNISYRRVHEAFEKTSSQVFPEHSPQINEYIKTLSKLLSVVDEFGKDHQQFPNVFSDGGKSKWEKLTLMKNYNDSQRYVAMCQLEKPLQRMFALRCVKQLDLKEKKESCCVGKSGSSGESTIQIVFRDYDVKLGGRMYELGLQFQGRSIKVNLCIKEEAGITYKKSSRNWISDEVREEFKSFASTFTSEFNDKWRFNDSKKTGLAYLSLSRNLGKENPLSGYSLDGLVSLYNEELNLARSRCSRIAEELKKIG